MICLGLTGPLTLSVYTPTRLYDGSSIRGEPENRRVWIGPLDLRYYRDFDSGGVRDYAENKWQGRLRDFRNLDLSDSPTLDGAIITEVVELPDSQRRYCAVSTIREQSR